MKSRVMELSYYMLIFISLLKADSQYSPDKHWSTIYQLKFQLVSYRETLFKGFGG